MAFKDEINYERISQINKKERKSAKLTNLDPEFYKALIAHLNQIQEEYNKKYSVSPTSTEALLLNNEICKLDGIIKEIYFRRERKILLLALDQNPKTDIRNMIEHEKKMYNYLMDILLEYRGHILDQKPSPVCDGPIKGESIKNDAGKIEFAENEQKLEQDNNASITPETQTEPTQLKPGTGQKPNPELSKNDNVEIIDKMDKNHSIDRILVRALADLKPFVGIDKVVYELHCEDLATIPKINAEILKKNNKVNFIEVNL